MRDATAGEFRSSSTDSQEFWNATVDAHAPEVWDTARALAPSLGAALEGHQLVWLRLEMLTRQGAGPQDTRRWLLDQIRTQFGLEGHGSMQTENEQALSRADSAE